MSLNFKHLSVAKIKITEYLRTYKELKENKEIGFDDPYKMMDTMNPLMRDAFLNKPTGYDPDEICQYIALDGNKIVGTLFFFRNRFLADGVEHGCQAGSTLYVHPDYRPKGIGACALMQFIDLHPEKNTISNGISIMAQPIYKALGFSFFETPRFISLRKSRSVIETILKTESAFLRPICWLIDIVMDGCNFLTSIGNRMKFRKYSIEKVDICPQEVEEIVLNDNHRFKELHDKKWFDWSLNYDYNNDDRKKKELYIVKNQKGEIVAFFLNKIKFFGQASHRGFKNVLLGTVSEWGIKEGETISEFNIQSLATRFMPKNVDACEVTSDNDRTCKSFKHHLFKRVGDVTMAVNLNHDIDPAYCEAMNWRIRIAGNDTLMD